MSVNFDGDDVVDLTANVEITDDGVIIYRDSQGRVHRDGAPAIQDTRNDILMWYRHGELHRNVHAAIIDRNVSRGIITMYWYQRGELHRDGGPAILVRSIADHSIIAQQYWRFGRRIFSQDGFAMGSPVA